MDITLYKVPIPHNKLDNPRDTGQVSLSTAITFRRSSKKILSGKSKKNPLINQGGNRQNINSDIREVWTADSISKSGKRYKIINRDLSGADALIVAYLCKPGRYRQLFENNIKVHTYNALHFFSDIWKQRFHNKDFIDFACECPIPKLNDQPLWKELSKLIKSSDEWESKERYYYFGKKSGLSFNYGQGEDTFIDTILKETEGSIVIERKEAARWKHLYHAKLFPEIQRDFQHNTIQYLRKHGCLRNLFGWPYNVPEKPNLDKISAADYNEFYAWCPQSTVATATLKAHVEMQDHIEETNKDWHLLGEVHDSIVEQAPEDEANDCAIQLGQFMKRELISPVDGVKFNLKSECKMGYNLGPYHKTKNPEGLLDVNI